MTISQVSAFPLIHRPYLYFYLPILPTICMSSSHQLFIHHNMACVAYFLPTVFISTVFLRIPTLDSGFVDTVLLVLSIAISVAHVTVTQRARSLMSFHAYSCPSTIRSFTASCQHPIHEQFNEFCNGSLFSTIRRLLPASFFMVSLLVGVHSCRNGKHGLVTKTSPLSRWYEGSRC
jgi:hypothetical protein